MRHMFLQLRDELLNISWINFGPWAVMLMESAKNIDVINLLKSSYTLLKGSYVILIGGNIRIRKYYIDRNS